MKAKRINCMMRAVHTNGCPNDKCARLDASDVRRTCVRQSPNTTKTCFVVIPSPVLSMFCCSMSLTTVLRKSPQSTSSRRPFFRNDDKTQVSASERRVQVW
ncbi:hypothetical protein L208DRAFT_41172 [Tricholoma matsutake]|nr:hypothetical protein L208DRAFT_41172 [Tricholoma matsutake 945]